MRVLALDSSTWWASLALVERAGTDVPRVVAELGFEVQRSHAPVLPRALEALLRLAGWGRDDPDGYVATRGPGSFTGIRVGLGTIRGLALAADRPCAAVTTLDALAEAHGPAVADRVPVISAGRGEFYAARYDGDSDPPQPLEGPWLGGPERLMASTRGAPAIVIPAHGTRGLLGDLAMPIRLAETPRSVAAAAGRVALLRGLLESDAETGLSPLYLRPPHAELDARAR